MSDISSKNQKFLRNKIFNITNSTTITLPNNLKSFTLTRLLYKNLITSRKNYRGTSELSHIQFSVANMSQPTSIINIPYLFSPSKDMNSFTACSYAGGVRSLAATRLTEVSNQGLPELLMKLAEDAGFRNLVSFYRFF